VAVPLLNKRKERPNANAMTLVEHLGELRHRVMVMALAFLIGATISFIFYPRILDLLQDPYCRVNHGNCSLYVTGPLDGLSLRIKIGAFGGLILSGPVILWQLWRFITPGLRPREKKYVVPFVSASIVLFLAGCAMAYVTFPHALKFLETVGGPGLKQIYSPSQYLGLITLMMLLFGITFEFPVLLVSLELAHVVTPARLLAWWRWAVILITVVAAVFTPSADPFSMLAMALPMVAFYFISIGIGKLFVR
jgi:sec-independent protein translocase protein TatC